MKFFKLISTFCVFSLITAETFSQTAASGWKGKIYFGYAGGNIKMYDLATKAEKTLLKDASQPFVTNTGDIFFVNDNYLKRNVVIRKSAPSLIQFKNVLDMSADNEQYKKDIENYSIIRGTGISGVLDRMSDPKVSPNGKYLSVTIFGYKQQAFEKNCVGVFEIATGRLVTKFEDKYYGTWTPDNRLVMAGSHKSNSSDETMYNSKTPGIFITDAAFTNATRIDPELDDPAPYHPAVSPDGKKVAFVLNNHIWVMDINGQNLKQVSDVANDNIETFPTWSPDGKYIAAWCYKTFERSYYTAVAIVPSNPAKPVALADKSNVWPKDAKGFRVSGGSMQLVWK